MATLDRIDKNGTKYYHTTTCYACDGTGTRPEYMHVESGRCFVCGGSGYKYHAWKEYTPEYAQKLADRRLAKAKKNAPIWNQDFCKSIGFSAEGDAWFVIGDTYAIKDQLKEAGARWAPAMGWHFSTEPAEFKCFKVNITEISTLDNVGHIQLNPINDVEEFFEAKQNEYRPKTASEYVGEVGQRLNTQATLVEEHSYTTHITYWGEMHTIYKFVDEAGNSLIWNTTSYTELETGKTYQLTGTVKEHNEYKGDKQTVLIRCKVKEAA